MALTFPARAAIATLEASKTANAPFLALGGQYPARGRTARDIAG